MKVNDTVRSFGFQQNPAPPILRRHPHVHEGRDDDIVVLHELIEELFTNLGCFDSYLADYERILIGADHKVANNIIRLSWRLSLTVRQTHLSKATSVPLMNLIHIRPHLCMII